MNQDKIIFQFLVSAGRRIVLSLMILLGVNCLPLFGQQVVRGIVIEKDGKRPVLGVTVTLKGTVTVTQTSADGSFSIQVNKEGDILVVQSIGYYTREMVVRGNGPLTIMLRNYCNIDYFDNQRISIGLQSGVKHTPLGGYLGISLPYFHTAGTAWTRAEYQSGQGAYIFRMEAGYDHMVSECDFRFDLKAGYTKVSKGTTVGAILYTAGGMAHLYRIAPGVRYLNLHVGAGLMYFNERNPSRWRPYLGPSIGLGTEIFQRNKVRINGQVLMVRHHPEVQLQVERPLYYRVRLFIRYYQLNEFKEITAGAGWSFYYRIKPVRRN